MNEDSRRQSKCAINLIDLPQEVLTLDLKILFSNFEASLQRLHPYVSSKSESNLVKSSLISNSTKPTTTQIGNQCIFVNCGKAD